MHPFIYYPYSSKFWDTTFIFSPKLPDEERIIKIQEQSLVPYSKAISLLEELDILYNLPKRDRMPNLLIVGSTNNGKSTILKKFMQKYPDYVEADNIIKPIIFTDVTIN